MVHETSPFENQEQCLAVLADLGSGTELDFLYWDGSAWSLVGASFSIANRVDSKAHQAIAPSRPA